MSESDKAIATMMLEINRLSIELEKATVKLNWLKNHASLTYQSMLNNVSE